MNWVGILLLIIHVISCSGLILIVLLQAGKGASLGAAFGGGSSQTMFGARSASLIGRLTWVLAGAFMLTSLLLTKFTPWQEFGPEAGAPSSILQQEPVAVPPADQTAEQPLAPVPSSMPSTSPIPEERTGTTQEEQEPEPAMPASPEEPHAQPESPPHDEPGQP